MPKVGNKHYPYTAKGKAAAKKAKAKMKGSKDRSMSGVAKKMRAKGYG